MKDLDEDDTLPRASKVVRNFALPESAAVCTLHACLILNSPDVPTQAIAVFRTCSYYVPCEPLPMRCQHHTTYRMRD